MAASRQLSTVLRRWAAPVAAMLAAAVVVAGGSPAAPQAPATPAEPAGSASTWTGTWATGVATPEAGQALEGFTDTTLRQRMHVSIGGDAVRLRLTNVYGTEPLVVRSTTLALPGERPGDVDPDTLVRVTFDGADEVVVPAGAEYVSDPIDIRLADDSDVLVSMYVPGPTGPATYHALAHATGWMTSGEHTREPDGAAFGEATTSYWFLDGLDVRGDVDGSVAFLGDSITDGNGSTRDADRRWPDYLADRMLELPRPHRFGVLNAGISGNRLLLDANSPGQGDNALARIERDVLTQAGVETVFVFEGVNDIQQSPSQLDPERLIAAYKQLVLRAHDQGVKVVGATIGPFRGWRTWTPEREAVRVAVNEWIRESGTFDAVVDFDAVLRDPEQPDRMLEEYDSGDRLHPGDAGYEAMAEAVDLAELTR